MKSIIIDFDVKAYINNIANTAENAARAALKDVTILDTPIAMSFDETYTNVSLYDKGIVLLKQGEILEQPAGKTAYEVLDTYVQEKVREAIEHG